MTCTAILFIDAKCVSPSLSLLGSFATDLFVSRLLLSLYHAGSAWGITDNETVYSSTMADSKDKTSMPSAAAGNPMGLAMPWFQQVISAAFAFGLQYVNFEGIVTERIGVTIDADTCRYAIIASLALALGMLGALVNAARAQYNVAWPFMMLNQVSALLFLLRLPVDRRTFLLLKTGHGVLCSSLG